MRCVAENYDDGRTRISEVVCARIGWRQPNGWLKDRACREALRRLEQLNIINLPPKITDGPGKRPKVRDRRTVKLPPGTVKPLLEMPKIITLEWSKGNSAESLWNAVVAKYHYLGHNIQVGRCLKYLIRGDGQLLGAISFSSPAWKIRVRDELLRRMGFTGKRAAHDFVVNNSRFLILPQVRVPHLASRVLAISTRQVAIDWLRYYSIQPKFAETFVERSRKGTCYRAANWSVIGATKGYAKLGASHHNSQKPKTLFVYGLSRGYRRKLATILSSSNPGTEAVRQ
jgi:hypothetical protein